MDVAVESRSAYKSRVAWLNSWRACAGNSTALTPADSRTPFIIKRGALVAVEVELVVGREEEGGRSLLERLIAPLEGIEFACIPGSQACPS
ncbi:MAG: hypothetical protein KGP12_03735 [Actinomycetales bacterium]|nr:hypothetical protein [Actinomycetales bacterium]